MKNDADLSLAPNGHSYAAGRSGRGISRSRAVDELWTGLDQLRFVHTIADLDTAEISRKLIALRDRLKAGGFIANLTGASSSGEATGAALKSLAAGWRDFGPPRPRNPALLGLEPFLKRPTASPAKSEIYASPSLQVGFAALVLPGSPFPSRDHAAETVLGHQLSTGALWEDIRMKGGAYGAFAYTDGSEKAFVLATYRDPNPLRSLGAFAAILRDQASQLPDEDALEKAIIGRYAKETQPRTAAEKGNADFSRFLYGVDDLGRERKLRALIDMSGADVSAAARRLADSAASALPRREAGSLAGPAADSALPLTPVIIAGTGAAREAAARLGVEPEVLPV
jgi:Zn-dependent M16 (insulinase) family peptidase